MEKNEKAAAGEVPEINYRGIKAMPFVIGNETFEKLGTTGTSNNLLIYLTEVFNMSSVSATLLVNVFNGTTNFASLLGAFLCDTYFGRYKTLGFACVASFLGMLMITLTAAISKLHPSHCQTGESGTCPGATPWQMVFLSSALGLLVVGAGGIRPCNLAFGADQFNPNKESGKRGINSFFNWYYFTFTFAMMISLTIIVYVQTDVSWALGLGIPAFLMLLSCISFFAGSRIYVKVKPDGSPLKSAVQVVVAATKKRRLMPVEQPWLTLFNYVPTNSINTKLPYTEQFRFLDKAAIITTKDEINPDGSAENPWNLCSMQHVEEMKCLLRVFPIWAASTVYLVVLVQQQTSVVFQAVQSDRRIGNSSLKIPGATYTIFTMLALTIWIPIYDRILVPLLQKITKKEGGITILQRMGVGMVLGIITMLISGLVEGKRRHLALTDPIGIDPKRGAISSMSGMWLVPQLSLVGISEAFAVVAQVEFYYKQFPENMRSIGASIGFCGLAGSSYLSGLLVTIVHRMTKGASTGEWIPEDLNKGRLDYFYYMVASLEVINFGYFLMCAKWYKYKGKDGNNAEVAMKNKQDGKPIV